MSTSNAVPYTVKWRLELKNFQHVLLYMSQEQALGNSAYSSTETAFMKSSRAISRVSTEISLWNVDYKFRILIRLMAREYFNVYSVNFPLLGLVYIFGAETVTSRTTYHIDKCRRLDNGAPFY
jgi:hypothetical protein